jgi:hypothetical protein
MCRRCSIFLSASMDGGQNFLQPVHMRFTILSYYACADGNEDGLPYQLYYHCTTWQRRRSDLEIHTPVK